MSLSVTSKSVAEIRYPQIEPKGAEIVRKIFDMYTEQNIPMGDIAARLNQSGYRTARGSLFETLCSRIYP